MTQGKGRAILRFSKLTPALLAWLVIAVLGVAVVWQKQQINEYHKRAFMRTKMEDARQRSACSLMKQGLSNSLIVVAGLLAQSQPPHFVFSEVRQAIPEVHGMDELTAANWIATHFHELKYDEKARTWRTTPGVTSQP